MVRARCIPGKDGFSTLVLSPRLALMYRVLKRPSKNGRKDRIQCAYFGFASEEQAQQFTAYVQEQFKARAVARESDRLPDSPFEVKVWEFEGLIDLALRCHARSQQQAA